MKAKRKLIITSLVVAFMLLSVVGVVAIAFALTQQTIKSSINIGYKADGIDGTATATISIAGGQPEYLDPSADAEHISEDGRSLVFKASDTENAGNLLFPEDALALTAQEYYVEIHYTYTNTGVKHYIASMDFAGNIVADNMKVEYSTDGEDYSEQRYALAVPAEENGVPGQRDYWIRISIENRAKSANFSGEFDWLLYACDPQDEAYLSIPSFEYLATGTDGAYQVALENTGSFGTRLVVPSSVNGDEVTTIAEGTLTPEQKAMVTSVYIPESVTTIGDNAFNGFTNLETVTLEQYLTTGGASAQAVVGLKIVGANAFKDCVSLTQLIIPNTITSYNSTALTGCTNLKNITLDTMNANAAVKALANENRTNNSNSEMNLAIGYKSLTKISDNAFKDSKGITNVIISDFITNIGTDAFNRCTDLVNVTIGSGITTIPGYAFQSTKLSRVTLPNGITSIGAFAFSNCTSLTEINIPNKVTTIANEAFNKCSALTEITIPSSVTTISGSAFIYCTGLTKVITPDINKWATINFGSGYANPLRYAKKLYLASDTENPITNITLANTVTKIGNYAFIDCQGITSFTIPSSVETVGTSAFSGCGIQKVITPDINKWARINFSDADANPATGYNLYLSSNLQANVGGDITLSGGITRIGSYAFEGFESLTGVTIPNTVQFVYSSAFANCVLLNSITIPNSITSFSSTALTGCNNLKYINLDTMNSGVLSAINSLEASGDTILTIGESETSIPENAFMNCSWLYRVFIPASVTYVGANAFTGAHPVFTFETTEGWQIYGPFWSDYQYAWVDLDSLSGSFEDYLMYAWRRV